MLSWPTDHIVTTGGVPLAARDYGGTGPPVVLLHGLALGMFQWDRFAPMLTDQHRVIAYDQRGHGASSDGQWDWEIALDDVAAIVAHFGLQNPALVGHSLGGAIATKWGLRHPECPGAVNIDMLRTADTDLANYVGMDSERARAERELVRAEGKAFAESFPPTFRAIGGLVRAENMFALFRRIQCPLLVCAAARNLPHQEAWPELLDAYRKGMERDIETIEHTNPNVRFAWLPGTHLMVEEIPEQLADLVRDFLAT